MELTNENLKQAKQELEAVCQKYDIALTPVVVHQGDRTFSSIEIVPRPRQQEPESTEESAPAAE